MKYLRKPCEAEATQWLSTNFNEIKEMAGDNVKLEGESLLVKMDGGWTPACYGVYIVKENDKCKIIEYDDFYKQYQKQEENQDKWCYSLNGVDFLSDFFDTKEQAVRNAKEIYGEDDESDVIWVGKAIEPDFKWDIDGQHFIESIIDNLENDVGEWAECFSVTAEEECALTEMINEAVNKWIEKYNIKPNCYNMEGVTKEWI